MESEGTAGNPSKRLRVSVEAFCYEVSTLLRGMESEITGHLSDLATGQEEMMAMCTQVDTKQDCIYQKLYELSTELREEKEKNGCISSNLKELADELRIKEERNSRQSNVIAMLNSQIRTKDALLAEAAKQRLDIHHKLESQQQQLERCQQQIDSLHQKLDMLLAMLH
jgi:chromosome segregation ATPase